MEDSSEEKDKHGKTTGQLGYVLRKRQTADDYQCFIYDWIYCYFFSPLDTVPIRFKGICSTTMLLLCSMRSKRERTPLYRNSICFKKPTNVFEVCIPPWVIFDSGRPFFSFSLIYFIHLFFLSRVCVPTRNCFPATATFSSCQSLLMFSFVILFCYNYINSSLAVCMLPEIYTWFSVYCCVKFKLFACFSKWILVKYT